MQMHLVLKDTAQDTKGYITVVVRDIELIKRRLNAIKEALEGTKFTCARILCSFLPHAALLQIPAMSVLHQLAFEAGEGAHTVSTSPSWHLALESTQLHIPIKVLTSEAPCPFALIRLLSFAQEWNEVSAWGAAAVCDRSLGPGLHGAADREGRGLPNEHGHERGAVACTPR